MIAAFTLMMLGISNLALCYVIRCLQKRVYRLEDEMAKGPFKREFRVILDEVVTPR